MQATLDRDRLRALGVEAARLHVTGNLKFEASEPAELPELADRVGRLAAGRSVIVAGSTMPGEEEKLFAAFAEVAKTISALLVVAPRHPERFDAVAELAVRRFPGAVRRSELDPAALPDSPPVLVLDTLGELASLYRMAQIAFIGGTLVARGGHNPIEAARFQVPVVVGRSMSNFQQIAAAFDRAGAWARVRDAKELARVWHRWLLDPTTAAEVGRRGRDLVDANRGALDSTWELLAPLVRAARSAGE